MKLIAFIIITAFVLYACKQKTTSGKISRDCTGTYLTVNNKDYHVCNWGILSTYDEGVIVDVKYENTTGCLSEDTLIVCELYHQNEGWIEVKTVE